MKRWNIREAKQQTVEYISQHFKLPVSLAHVLVSRGLDTPEKIDAFFDLSLSHLMSPFDLSNMERACAWIVEAIENKQKILIHGDFDADGITSSALFSLFFDKIGYPIEVYIPNRLQENHGVSKIAIQKAVKEEFSLVITCDCGSSSHDSIQELIDQNVRVIVTDHHHVGDPLPEGALLVNPQQECNDANMEELSGVGVVFLTLMALRKVLREKNYFEHTQEPNLKSFLDIVALGTIADLAPIQGMNRILVAKGLEVMKQNPQVGISALTKVGGVDDQASISSEDVGFRIAPKINAAARLGFADQAYDLLVCQDPQRAKIKAEDLHQYNDQRKSLQEKMFRKAYPEVQRQVEMGHHVLIVASKDFHPGIIGLLAQKIAQEFQKPAFAFCIEGEKARGSARSPQGFHLLDLMNTLSEMFSEFGGHAQAGGCGLKVEQLQEFTTRIQKEFENLYRGKEEIPQWVDASLDLTEVNEMFFQKLEKLQPFGMGYPYPVFETTAEIVGKPFEVGNNHLKCKVKDRHGRAMQVIAFGKYQAWKDQFLGQKTMVIQPQRQYFRGSAQISLQLLDFA